MEEDPEAAVLVVVELALSLASFLSCFLNAVSSVDDCSFCVPTGGNVLLSNVVKLYNPNKPSIYRRFVRTHTTNEIVEHMPVSQTKFLKLDTHAGFQIKKNTIYLNNFSNVKRKNGVVI